MGILSLALGLHKCTPGRSSQEPFSDRSDSGILLKSEWKTETHGWVLGT